MLMNKLVLNWWQESNKQVRGQLVPPQRSDPLGKQQQCRDGCSGSGDWGFIRNYAHKLWERQRFRPRWCLPLWIAVVVYGSKARRVQPGLGAVAVPSPCSRRCWMVILAPQLWWLSKKPSVSLWDQLFPRCVRVMYRRMDMTQPCHA